MPALTRYGMNGFLNAMFRGDPLPATWYYALYTTIQDEDETGTECPDSNYARQIITFTAAADGLTENIAQILFPAFATTQSILAIGIADAVAGGHAWIYMNLGAQEDFIVGQQARVLAGYQNVTAT